MKRRLSTLAFMWSIPLALWACDPQLAGSNPSGKAGGTAIGDGDQSGDGDTPGDGDISGDGDTRRPGPGDCETSGVDAGANVLRRLSRVEYQLTLQDLFLLDSPPNIELIPEDNDRDGFTSFSDLQSVSAQHLRAYLDTTEAILDALESDVPRYELFVGCTPEEAGCLETFVSRFGRLAFRRALTPEESSTLVAAAIENALSTRDQIRYATETLLVSPHFLFRVEVGNTPDGLSSLSAQELASKLSFTVWGRSPSETLLDSADAGDLDTPEGFIDIARAMLSDPKAEAFYGEFFKQWLGYGKLRTPIDPPADWSDALMPEMIAETDRLIAEHTWAVGQNFWDILTANHTTLSPELAAFYGLVPDASGRVEFAEGDPRSNAGILGHASLLSQKTDGDKISVRGNWVRGTFLCQELHIPQELADALGEQLVGLTSMQIIEKRNEEQPCKGCHSVIDPIGVGLAQFDATGRYDASIDLSSYPIEPGFPDAEDPTFTTLRELSEKLRERPELNACITEKAFIYALGRDARPADACAFEGATNGFSAEGGSFPSLLFNLIVSDGFRLRRAPSTP